jgi:hypothetical protein
MSRSRRGGANAIQLFVLLAAFVLLAYYLMVSLTSRDLLWILSRFRDEPSHIVVYQNGQRTEFRPGQPGYEELATAAKASMAEGFARLTSTGFSEETLQSAYNQYLTLEVFFAHPVEIHTWFPTGRTTQILFPISGPHAQPPIVLLGDEGHYRAGAPVLSNNRPIVEALGALGFD